jgi:hypothetical protein
MINSYRLHFKTHKYQFNNYQNHSRNSILKIHYKDHFQQLLITSITIIKIFNKDKIN